MRTQTRLESPVDKTKDNITLFPIEDIRFPSDDVWCALNIQADITALESAHLAVLCITGIFPHPDGGWDYRAYIEENNLTRHFEIKGKYDG